MGTERCDEVERKYDVDEATVLPNLAGPHGVARVGQPVELELEAVYFDTADLALARRGITLRRRTGGQDDGWHVKLPRHGDTRTEVRAPLGRAVRTVPKPLRTPLSAVLRDRSLEPVVRITTRRLERELLDEDDVVLARLCDDAVHAARLRDGDVVQEWREWEVELAEGDGALLDLVEGSILEAGGRRSTSGSKLARALGDSVPRPAPTPSRKELRRSSAGDVFRHHVATRVAALHEQDRRLRAGEPGSIHKMRIAARSIRCVLTTYAPLFAARPEALRDELRWLGQALSPARDAQVLRERLAALVADEPEELVLGAVATVLDDDLGQAERHGREQALAVLEDPRYYRLLDALDLLIESPPLDTAAEQPARGVLPRLLQRDAKRLRRAVKGARGTDPGTPRDLALHEARKKAKRLRYAAESTVPVLGKRAKRFASSAKRVQQALGEHQDTVMTRRVLREQGARAHVAGRNGFTLGRLHALEQARAESAVRDFDAAWRNLPTRRLRRRLTA